MVKEADRSAATGDGKTLYNIQKRLTGTFTSREGEGVIIN